MNRISLAELNLLESEHNFSLPYELKEFLCLGDLKLEKRNVRLKDGAWESETKLHGFYSTLEGIKSSFDNLSEPWWPDGYISFAYDEGGEAFCVCIKPEKAGQIYYFMSDCIGEDPEDAMLFVSNSFTEFLNSLE